jgi:hypothetical protein
VLDEKFDDDCVGGQCVHEAGHGTVTGRVWISRSVEFEATIGAGGEVCLGAITVFRRCGGSNTRVNEDRGENLEDGTDATPHADFAAITEFV